MPWFRATALAAVAVAAVFLRPVFAPIRLPLTTAALMLSSPLRSHLRCGRVGVSLVLLAGRGRLLGRRRDVGLGLGIAVKLAPAVFLPWLVVPGSAILALPVHGLG